MKDHSLYLVVLYGSSAIAGVVLGVGLLILWGVKR